MLLASLLLLELLVKLSLLVWSDGDDEVDELEWEELDEGGGEGWGAVLFDDEEEEVDEEEWLEEEEEDDDTFFADAGAGDGAGAAAGCGAGAGEGAEAEFSDRNRLFFSPRVTRACRSITSCFCWFNLTAAPADAANECDAVTLRICARSMTPRRDGIRYVIMLAGLRVR